MNSKQFIEIRRLIENEFANAVTKHPKFCKTMIDDEGGFSWEQSEIAIKKRNGDRYADDVLLEEVAEAFNAYSKGDLDNALHEFAQVGAVAMRCMFFVMAEKLKRENHG